MVKRGLRLGLWLLLAAMELAISGCMAHREPMVVVEPSYSHVRVAATAALMDGTVLTAAPTVPRDF